MKHLGAKVGKFLLGAAVLSLASWAGVTGAQSRTPTPDTEEIRIIELQGKVEIMPAGATTWVLTTTNQPLHSFDRLRTWTNSRVSLLWSVQSVVPLGALTEIEVLPAQDRVALPGLHMMRGLLSFFHRDRPGRIRVITRGGANASINGTEFALAVDSHNGQELATLSVIDGEVEFGNGQGPPLILTNLQQAVAEPGKAPIRTRGFDANNILQWCFYYPGVLDPDELQLSADEKRSLNNSLTAYRAGDVLQALAKFPSPRQSASDAEKVYYAALQLSVGQAGQAGDALVH
jgi:hypothetical protein